MLFAERRSSMVTAGPNPVRRLLGSGKNQKPTVAPPTHSALCKTVPPSRSQTHPTKSGVNQPDQSPDSPGRLSSRDSGAITSFLGGEDSGDERHMTHVRSRHR
jgi:hypothetical protein